MVGAYFTRQLLESRHRGAFELAYAGFIKMTDTLWRYIYINAFCFFPTNSICSEFLWHICLYLTVGLLAFGRSSIPVMQSLPDRWLRDVIDDIRHDVDGSRLCATRRSAGLPFYVTALVTSEPKSSQRATLKFVMAQLMPLAVVTQLPVTSGDAVGHQHFAPQVHALNVLRALVRDARLAADVTPHVCDVMRAAISAYSSAYWGVRNAGTLLFSAMVTRVFGVKRGKDMTSRRNYVTARAFFMRYPALYDFLLAQISAVQPDTG